jgi:tubulin-specific chaperone A
MSEVLKQLKVRTGVVKRLTKELGYYSKERDDEAARVEKMRADGKDSHDIKQAVGDRRRTFAPCVSFAPCVLMQTYLFAQENCLAESAMMIPQTREKLEAGFADLEACVVGAWAAWACASCMHAW